MIGGGINLRPTSSVTPDLVRGDAVLRRPKSFPYNPVAAPPHQIEPAPQQLGLLRVLPFDIQPSVRQQI